MLKECRKGPETASSGTGPSQNSVLMLSSDSLDFSGGVAGFAGGQASASASKRRSGSLSIGIVAVGVKTYTRHILGNGRGNSEEVKYECLSERRSQRCLRTTSMCHNTSVVKAMRKSSVRSAV